MEFIAMDWASGNYGAAALDVVGAFIPGITGPALNAGAKKIVKFGDDAIKTVSRLGDDALNAIHRIGDNLVDGKTKLSSDPRKARSYGQVSGWKVGDPLDNLTSAGNVPSWSTVRQRYWKNEAYYDSGRYDDENLERL